MHRVFVHISTQENRYTSNAAFRSLSLSIVYVGGSAEWAGARRRDGNVVVGRVALLWYDWGGGGGRLCKSSGRALSRWGLSLIGMWRRPEAGRWVLVCVFF